MRVDHPAPDRTDSGYDGLNPVYRTADRVEARFQRVATSTPDEQADAFTRAIATLDNVVTRCANDDLRIREHDDVHHGDGAGRLFRAVDGHSIVQLYEVRALLVRLSAEFEALR